MEPTAAGTAAPATMGTVVIGARRSKLAQIMVAEFLAGLGGSCPVMRFQNRVVQTDGDKDRRSPLSAVGGASGGAFTSQLEAELREHRIDVAVHSLKDLPTSCPTGSRWPRRRDHAATSARPWSARRWAPCATGRGSARDHPGGLPSSGRFART
jgi:hypothetical protein